MAKKKTESEIVAQITKEFGDDVLETTAEIPSVIPTGSFSLDVSTTIGGIPMARYSHIWGPESSGKTTLGIHIARECLDRKGKVLYIDIEQTLDSVLLTSILGKTRINSRDFIIIRPEVAEDSFKIAEMAVRSKDIDLVIFDSVGALVTDTELEADFEDQHYAPLSRVLTRFLKRNAFAVRVNKVAFLFLNQVRAKIGSFIKEYEMPGGHALKHYSSIGISLFKSSYIKTNDDTKIGNMVNFSIQKSKIGIPYRSAKFPIIWGEGIDYYRDIIIFAGSLGIVKSRGAYKVFKDETLGQGILKSIEYLKANKEVLDKIIEMCYNVVGVRPLPLIGQDENEEKEEKEAE